MLWTIVVLLLILWLLGFTLHVAGGLIHLLLVVALVAGHDAATTVKHDESGTCRALVESA